MSEQLCTPEPVRTELELKTLLADSGGRRYYEQMEHLPVNQPALRAALERTCASRIRTWLEICAHCGMCGPSCFFYMANNQAPYQIPSHKIQSTLGVMLRRKGQVSTRFMIEAMDTAWGQCTCCNRCGLYCPHGIDTGVMFSVLRGLLFEQGFVPWELKIGSGMHRVYGAQMDVRTEDWVETCAWMVEENEETWPGLTIPIDQADTDTLYILNAREPKHYPQDVADAARLFQLAGESWTVTSEGWDSTSLSLFAGDWEGCGMNVRRIYGAVERLRPRRVVGTECGHAHRATVVEGPYLAGRKDGKPPVPFIHYVQWAAEALREGRLRIDPSKKITQPVTIQDSCNYVRGNGLGRYTREILSYMADDVREMPSHGDHAQCCGGGGGLNGIGRYRSGRDRGLRAKLDQVRACGAQLVITPCHNCWDAVRDMISVYAVPDITWSLLKPLLLHMVIPEPYVPPVAPAHQATSDGSEAPGGAPRAL